VTLRMRMRQSTTPSPHPLNPPSPHALSPPSHPNLSPHPLSPSSPHLFTSSSPYLHPTLLPILSYHPLTSTSQVLSSSSHPNLTPSSPYSFPTISWPHGGQHRQVHVERRRHRQAAPCHDSASTASSSEGTHVTRVRTLGSIVTRPPSQPMSPARMTRTTAEVGWCASSMGRYRQSRAGRAKPPCTLRPCCTR